MTPGIASIVGAFACRPATSLNSGRNQASMAVDWYENARWPSASRMFFTGSDGIE